jgi:nucleotide-binding universal stress UspA family protein
MAKPSPRIFLVVADQSPEMTLALRYAAIRAQQVKGRVAILYVIEPIEIQPWRAVDRIFAADAVASGKKALKKYEEFVERTTAHKPIAFIRRGQIRTELLRLLDEEPEISVLVLAAHKGPEGPGPLVTYLTSVKGLPRLKIPLVIVPESYTLETGETGNTLM